MIGIYGGTFDPVHYGHLRTAVEIKALFKLSEVRLIPCARPPHRDAPMTDAEQRLTMLHLALDGQPGLIVDDCEIRRKGPSYTIDTLVHLKTLVVSEALILFMGTDAFAGIDKWYQWQRLLDYAHIVVITRPGYQMPRPTQENFGAHWVSERAQLETDQAGKVYFQTLTQLDISATAIRTLLQQGQDARFLLPDKVLNFIQQHHLYQATPFNLEK